MSDYLWNNKRVDRPKIPVVKENWLRPIDIRESLTSGKGGNRSGSVGTDSIRHLSGIYNRTTGPPLYPWVEFLPYITEHAVFRHVTEVRYRWRSPVFVVPLDPWLLKVHIVRSLGVEYRVPGWWYISFQTGKCLLRKRPWEMRILEKLKRWDICSTSTRSRKIQRTGVL